MNIKPSQNRMIKQNRATDSQNIKIKNSDNLSNQWQYFFNYFRFGYFLTRFMNIDKSVLKSIFLILPLIFIFLTSCTEKIDIKLDDSYTRLVVEGSVTTDSARHWVKLATTSSYFNNQPEPMISGATVSLTDGSTTWQLVENPGMKGYYYPTNAFKGKIGKTYSLQIDNVTIGGVTKSYKAECNLAGNGRMDSIAMQEIPGFDYWLVKLYAQDPPDTANFYMFNLYRNGVLITDTIQNVTTSDDVFFDGNYTNGIQVQFFNKNKVNPGDTLTLEMDGITKEYFTFLENLKTEAGPHIPLFDGPPANVIGNITNGAVGFFSAYSIAKASTIIPSSKKKLKGGSISPFILKEISRRK